MKTLTIALATAKEAIRQPAFFVLAFLAGASLIYTIFVPYFTFGEDIKMYKDTGLTTISFAALLLALLTASSSVAEEIEGKTAVTLLSKPVNRRQFLLGKFLGIQLGVLTLFLILGTLFAAGVFYKTQYDAREMSRTIEGGTPERLLQVAQVLPGLVLGFFEVTVLTAISVAISTRLPMLVNLVVMIAVFFLGHLTPILVDVSEQAGVNELVRFMARLFQWVLPSLEFFNAGPAIATGAVIPWFGYVLPALVYCVLYSGAALFFAFLLFENRDVA
jgi:ABC-type transport system involved in multi-copper enzyme maturation permease subunit